MTLPRAIQGIEHFITRNSPAILTGLGVAGALSSVYLTGKATIKARDLLTEGRVSANGYEAYVAELDLTPREQIELVWKEYIPAAGMTALTVMCIIAANRVGTRRAAAMAAAYSLSERAFAEYREVVVERLGENKERGVREEIAKRHVREHDFSNIIVTNGKSIFMCGRDRRTVESTMQAVLKAQNDFNYKLMNNVQASLNDFYELIDMPRTKDGDDLGWTSDQKVELHITTCMTDDEDNPQACFHFDFIPEPKSTYYNSH